MGNPRAVIFGCAGTTLSGEEKAFFADAQPLGFILFKRNVDTPKQVRVLVEELRSAVGRDDAPILIDQEGGRVQRLGPPNWLAYPAQHVFAEVAERKGLKAGCKAARLNATLIAMDLRVLGIDVNCLPLLDVPTEDSHDIIGDRAYGSDPDIVAALGNSVCEGLMDGGVLPIVKHIPGHGRAKADSHLELPVVDASIELLRETDFRPFCTLAHAPWGMTAHIVYSDIDADAPATLSPIVIADVIRHEIGFDGFLVSDDLNMKALSGSYGNLAARAIDAGCDAVLHCDGNMEDMRDMVPGVPALSSDAMTRLKRAKDCEEAAEQTDRERLMTRLAELLAP